MAEFYLKNPKFAIQLHLLHGKMTGYDEKIKFGKEDSDEVPDEVDADIFKLKISCM